MGWFDVSGDEMVLEGLSFLLLERWLFFVIEGSHVFTTLVEVVLRELGVIVFSGVDLSLVMVG